jgi:hypothetical protein
MAPEQLAQLPATKASDWYAVGVILYQALIGTLPDRTPSDPATRQAETERALFSLGIPSDLRALCCGLLNSDPGQRPTGREVIARLGVSGLVPSKSVDYPSEGDVFVGRESQLESLRALFELTKQGRAVVANLHGDSGLGKTTVLRMFRRRILRDDPDVVVLAGRCHENETVPYKALDDLVDSLAGYLKTIPEAMAESLTPHDVHCLMRIFPVLAQVDALTRVRLKTADIVDSQELRERAFGSLQDLLMRLSERRILIMMIDDLQWGDLDSAAFLSKLLAGATPPSLMLIASYRSADVDASPFLQRWRLLLAAVSAVDVHDVAIEPLTTVDSIELAKRLAVREEWATREWLERIAAESEGNPFLIDQLARRETDLAARDRLVSVWEILHERITRLLPAVQWLLETIALAGQPISCEVANVASDIEAHDRVQLWTLVREKFVRVREAHGPKQVEPYHDRIREAIVSFIPSERRHRRHLCLARALEVEQPIDASLVATHFEFAGELDAAARYSLTAADQALEALAFDRAVQWYRRTLDVKTREPYEEVNIHRKLAHALVHAGQGGEAAQVYLRASHGTTSFEQFEFKRLAAEQLLRTGRVNEGFDVLHAVASDLGVWLPSARWSMLASLLWHRSKIACRGLKPRRRRSKPMSLQETITLDVYWSLAQGLLTLDVARSVEFQSRHLLRALRVEDPDRLAMALAAEGVQRATSARRNLRVVNELFVRAGELALGTKHPQARGFIATVQALASLLAGDWQNAQRLSIEADVILREKCTGVTWEIATNALVSRTATVLLGQWSQLEEPLFHLGQMHKAAEKHDLYAVHAMSGSAYTVCLATDRPDLAKSLVRSALDALSASPVTGYLLPRLWLMIAGVDTALYEGNPREAWALVNGDWPMLSKSLHFRVEYVANWAHYCRARAAVSIAQSGSFDATACLGEAIRCARRLERYGVTWAQSLAKVIRAGVASVEGRLEAAMTLLAESEPLAARASMAWIVAGCEYRRGMLLGGTGGRELVSSAEAWAEAERVVNAPRIFDVFFPGNWSAHNIVQR